jgi:hypothetical protein
MEDELVDLIERACVQIDLVGAEIQRGRVVAVAGIGRSVTVRSVLNVTVIDNDFEVPVPDAQRSEPSRPELDPLPDLLRRHAAVRYQWGSCSST